MDPRLLSYYERELHHLREMGGEFASEFPKIAGRLGLDAFECADPYVERLLEGFSFLAARVQLKLDAQFPRFVQHLLEVVYPHYLTPIPSMAVVQFQPDLMEGSLAEGFTLPRDTVLRSILGKGDQTPCHYRTAHEIALWPLELVEAEYFSRDVASLGIPDLPGVRAGLRLRLRTTAGLTFDKLSLDRLPVYLRGGGELAARLHEQLLGNTVSVLVRPPGRPAPWQEILKPSYLQAVGFDDSQALLPYGPQSFHGYRLLQEYFAFPDRYRFAEFRGLASAVRRCDGNELDVIVLLNRNDSSLESRVDAENFALFCSPAINLFPKRADRIHLDRASPEHHIVPDRTRPLDFEVFSVSEVVGYGADEEQEFAPFFAISEGSDRIGEHAFFTVQRTPRVLSSRQREYGPRSAYIGSEVFLSLVDESEAPYRYDLRQLAVATMCTNRDLPLQMPVGQGQTDFSLEASAPVKSVRCVAGPTKPRPSPVMLSGEIGWRLISHLSLNYLSLLNNDQRQGAAAIRELLGLYADASEASVRKQVEGVRSIDSAPVVRRVPRPGPIAFARGMQIKVTLDETAFEGGSVFLLGAVLEKFFAKYVSINSFTETVVDGSDRGEIMRWPARIGTRHTL